MALQHTSLVTSLKLHEMRLQQKYHFLRTDEANKYCLDVDQQLYLLSDYVVLQINESLDGWCEINDVEVPCS